MTVQTDTNIQQLIENARQKTDERKRNRAYQSLQRLVAGVVHAIDRQWRSIDDDTRAAIADDSLMHAVDSWEQLGRFQGWFAHVYHSQLATHWLYLTRACRDVRRPVVSLQSTHTNRSGHNTRLDQTLPDPFDHENNVYVKTEYPNVGPAALDTLTDHEHDVVWMIFNNWSYEEIAAASGCSIKSIDNARTRAMRKLRTIGDFYNRRENRSMESMQDFTTRD